jgi:hypothetical protein
MNVNIVIEIPRTTDADADVRRYEKAHEMPVLPRVGELIIINTPEGVYDARVIEVQHSYCDGAWDCTTVFSKLDHLDDGLPLVSDGWVDEDTLATVYSN